MVKQGQYLEERRRLWARAREELATYEALDEINVDNTSALARCLREILELPEGEGRPPAQLYTFHRNDGESSVLYLVYATDETEAWQLLESDPDFSEIPSGEDEPPPLNREQFKVKAWATEAGPIALMSLGEVVFRDWDH